MNNNEDKITIEFRLVSEFGDEFSSSTTSHVFNELGETDMMFIGEKLNTFLKQCGYFRKNDYIFMEDVTEDELTALEDYLAELREKS